MFMNLGDFVFLFATRLDQALDKITIPIQDQPEIGLGYLDQPGDVPGPGVRIPLPAASGHQCLFSKMIAAREGGKHDYFVVFVKSKDFNISFQHHIHAVSFLGFLDDEISRADLDDPGPATDG